MSRRFYTWLLGLHPRVFRKRFAQEMLAIFDEVAACQNTLNLFGDIVVSLFRQWVLRPEFRTAEAAAAPAVATEVPVFASLESYRLGRTTMLGGSLVSLVAMFAAVAAISHSGKPLTWLIGAHRVSGNLLVASRSSMAGAEPNTLVRLPEDPWRAAASIYFKVIPVLGALDTDGDFVISPTEIEAAPSTLRRLDRNHDGKLSAEECGLNLGERSNKTLSPEFEKRARIWFMRFHPVLAALDYDHDGVISAEEIRNSSQSLRGLDINGDGSLTPDEVMPTGAAAQAASIFSRLDTNHDGWISGADSDGSEALIGIVMSADRNHDGVTTLAELINELRRREWIQRQTDASLKAARATR